MKSFGRRARSFVLARRSLALLIAVIGSIQLALSIGPAPATTEPVRAVKPVAARTPFAAGLPVLAATPTYERLADVAVGNLVDLYYDERGLWRDCASPICWVHNNDWGSDALTNTLALRYSITPDPRVPARLAALARTERRYAAPCRGKRCLLWSDVPMWDSIAASREHRIVPNDTLAFAKAKAAFAAVEGSPAYDVGACPAIRYQRPYGRGDHLKTLETDSNGVKAALLLFENTHDRSYLRIARTRYDAIRAYFLDPERPLYSVYVFDDGKNCRQVPHRFFASVNGNMIWNGLRLYHVTGDERYRDEALATAHAVAADLSDPRGVFMDMQAENDLEEPLVEAMYVLARHERESFARDWLIANASAAYSARKADGSYGRFFDGPPPEGIVTAWQTNGGLAAEIAAAALEPSGTPSADGWRSASFVRDDVTSFPVHVRFTGSGIALVGMLGEKCCQPGHARVFVDGVETLNRIGTWQNKSSSGHRFPSSILFAWRWPAAGPHDVALYPGSYNAKEGGPFIHLSGYVVR